ncbi:hypothetical protein HanPI659440_Chr13g0500911 [Helianthus annuus]|nr:hypothetical protein HanPI659440_Chr13g0500911 [Helianthus annuus]
MDPWSCVLFCSCLLISGLLLLLLISLCFCFQSRDKGMIGTLNTFCTIAK